MDFRLLKEGNKLMNFGMIKIHTIPYMSSKIVMSLIGNILLFSLCTPYKIVCTTCFRVQREKTDRSGIISML